MNAMAAGRFRQWRAGGLFGCLLFLHMLYPGGLWAGHEESRVGFTLRVGSNVNPYYVLGHFPMPGADVDFAIDQGNRHRYDVEVDGGSLRLLGRNHWRWTAPHAPGLYPVTIRRLGSSETMTLNMFVMVPRTEKRAGQLNGYRMGAYPRRLYRGLDIYRAPPGFVEVSEPMMSARVSPHFRIGQFVSRQGGGFPRYVVLRPRMVLFLEAILEELRAEGMHVPTLEILSGYRTPWYNGHIGNGEYSRHVWGGAADIYIDREPPDGRMDDLTGDGRSDIEDARSLAAIVDRLQRRQGMEHFMGGLGAYGPRPHRGPFVHVDVRGFEARWEVN